MTQPLIQSFKCAAAGIVHSAVYGRNFKIELGFGVAAILLGIFFQIDATQWAVVALCIGVVLGSECANTALEAVVDLVSPDYSELARVAKDCAAGAVLVTSIASLFVAAFVFLPKILVWLGFV